LAHQVDARSCSNAATDDSCVRLHRCRQEAKTLGGCSSICLCIHFWECFRSHLLGNQKILQEASEELVRDHTCGDEATGLDPLHDHADSNEPDTAEAPTPTSMNAETRAAKPPPPAPLRARNGPAAIPNHPTTRPTNRPTPIAPSPAPIPTNQPTTIANYPPTT